MNKISQIKFCEILVGVGFGMDFLYLLQLSKTHFTNSSWAS